MGLVHPRPAMRRGEARKIKANLARHWELMQKYIAEGKSREEASTLALKEMRGQTR